MSREYKASLMLALSVALFFIMQLVSVAFVNMDYIWLLVISTLLISVVSLLLPALFAIKGNNPRDFGFISPGVSTILISIALGVGAFFISTGINAFTTALMETLGANSEIYSQGIEGAAGLGQYMLLVVLMCVFPAVCEETMFRSVLVTSWRHIGRKKVIMLSGMLFALMHITPSSIPSFFVLGAIIAALMYDTKSVIPAIIVHFVNNFISISLLSLASNSDLVDLVETAQAVEQVDIGTLLLMGVIYMVIGAIIAAPSFFAIKGIAKKRTYEKRLAYIESGETPIIDIEPEQTKLSAPARNIMICTAAVLVIANVAMFLFSFVQL